ncbi:hypothetical protein MKW94_016366, partial [Papaver nudicaule]|nr:hypothetical protein [Papaver nudicaule]
MVEAMNEEIQCSGTTLDSNSSDYTQRMKQYRLNARRRLSNFTAEEKARWLARRAESQRQRRRGGKARSMTAGPSDNVVVAREQSMNRIGPAIPRGARLSSIRRLARDHCSTTAENFEDVGKIMAEEGNKSKRAKFCSHLNMP